MSRSIMTVLMVAGLAAQAPTAEPEAPKPVPRTVPTTVRLNNEAPYAKALDNLMANPPAADANVENKVDHAMRVCSAAFTARKYDVAERMGRLILSIYSAEDEKAFPEFLSMLHSNLSVYLGKQGRFEEAEKEARRALVIHPESMHAKLVLPSWLWERGRKDEALAMVKAVPKPDGEDQLRTYHGCLACFYATTGDEDALKENMEKAMAVDPQSKDFFARDVVFDPYRAKPWFDQQVGETLAK